MTNAIKFDRLATNAQCLRHGSHTLAMAGSLLGLPVRSLCCWCAERVEGEARRLGQGGECEACSYVGTDCLAILVEAGG